MGEQRREDILLAVSVALSEHGYARLTMQDIADEAGVSKAALHYHYDTKRDLLLAFLDDLYERFTGRLAAAEGAAGEDPVDRLVAVVDAALDAPETGEVEGFRTAVLEIEAQAPYVPAYRERLADFYGFLEARVAGAVADGVERGRFPETVDPAAAAGFVVTAIAGAHTRSVATGHPITDARAAILDYVDGLAAGGAAADVGSAGPGGEEPDPDDEVA